ncbi:MAG: 3'-5' exonuclease, partial [Opitutaceae bacterium]
KRATFGLDEKRLAARLDRFLDGHQDVFLAGPQERLWGEAQAIWPDGNPWLEAKAQGAPAARALSEWLARAELTDKSRRRWEDFLAAAQSWLPGATMPRPLEYVLEKALERIPELQEGRSPLQFDHGAQNLDPSAARALAQLVCSLAAAELACRLSATQGVHAVLRGYEALYHDAVRRGGRLTFSDVQRLLEPVRLFSGGDDRMGAGRLSIDYRLDGEIDHWLLDEFQDTSFGQWSILRNLVDEVVQDTSGERTFFCVGDVKQAIYVWREGDPRLFAEIFRHYNAAVPGTIADEHLDRSWRSGPPVIGLVNGIFGAAPVLARLFPGAAGRDWNAEWRAHETAVPERGGQAALLFAQDREDRLRIALDLLQEIAPVRRGLSCAVLVQDNATATELADFLRAQGGLPAVTESDQHVCADNPLGVALLALVQAAAHPGDSLAWQHVRMSPLGAILAGESVDQPDALALRVLREVHEEGFGRALERWVALLDPSLSREDRFSRARARQFVAAAKDFDATSGPDPDEFVEFMKAYAVREPQGSAVIRVMTVHKAKGLDFDLVVLPDLQGNTLLRARAGLAVRKAADRSVDWILDLPPKLFSENDPVLRAYLRDAEAAACYEKLSLLYVAVTRARRGLYLIVEPPAKSSVSANFPRLLVETLGGEPGPIRIGSTMLSGPWMSGDPEWHLAAEPSASVLQAASNLEPIGAGRGWGPRRPPSRRPTDGAAPGANPARLFSPTRSRETGFGAEIHALLAQIEWAEAEEREKRVREWSAGGPAEKEAAACLAAEALRSIWERPGNAELWRERAFEAVIGGAWVSGVFDRVVVIRKADGQPERADLYDFKTDRVDAGAEPAAAAERHVGQLAWYRRAVRALTGLPESAIGCEVVFTRTARRVPV